MSATGVTPNTLHPAGVRTSLETEDPAVSDAGRRHIDSYRVRSRLKEVTGAYFANGKPTRSPQTQLRRDRRLWRVSADLADPGAR